MILVPDEHDGLDAGLVHIWPFCYEDMYLAVLGIRKTARLGGNIVENQLAYTRDGLHWRRMGERRPFLTAGPRGSWEDVNTEGFCIVPCDDRIRCYYVGVSRHDPNLWEAIGLATMRLDGFVSLDAPRPDINIPRESTLLTKPLWSTGSRLVVNAEAKGYINAELTDPDGRVLKGFGHEECDPFTGDCLRHAFSWQGRENIGGLFPLRIRFRMRDAGLYALQSPRV